MQQIELEVNTRTETGSAAARRIRREGRLPAVVYSHGQESLASTVDQRQFIKVASASRSSQVFTLKSNDKRIDGRSALVKDVQKDFLKNAVLHVDILAVRDDEELTVTIPVKVVGESPGVKNDGGILAFVSHEIDVRCLPKFIPDELIVDISHLQLGQSVHAREVPLTEGVKLAGNPDLTVVSVVAVRSLAEDETSTSGPAAATDGATPAAGAEGAAPAAAKEGAKK